MLKIGYVLSLGLLMASQSLQAGQIVLQNGDHIEGQLERISEDKVIWRSKHLGELKLDKTQILSIRTDGKFKVRGRKASCEWYKHTPPKVTFRCSDGKLRRISLLSLKHVIPYKNHEKTNRDYGGDIRVSGWKQTGNRETEYWEVHSDVRLRHADLRHNVVFNVRGQSTENTAGNTVVIDRQKRGKALYALDWFFLPKWYWSNRLSGELDSTRNIDEEFALSSGIGYQFWESKTSALANELGLQYSKTRFDDVKVPGAEPETYTSFRFSTDYRYKFPLSMSFFHKHELTRSVDERVPGQALRWEFDSETGVNMPIGFGVSASFGVDWDYVNQAQDQNPEASKSDAIYRVGLNYDW